MTDLQDLVTNRMATRPADARTLLTQIGPRVLASVGAHDIVNLGDGVQFAIGGRAKRKLVIKLAADDTYTLERVRLLGAPSFEVESEEVSEDIYAENLAEVVLRMGDVE